MPREDKLSNAEKVAFSSTFFSDYRKFARLSYLALWNSRMEKRHKLER